MSVDSPPPPNDYLTVGVKGEIFQNTSNMVKESALLTALRWNIKIFEKEEES